MPDAPATRKYRKRDPMPGESQGNKMAILALIGIMLVLIVLGVIVLVVLFMGRIPSPGGLPIPGVTPPAGNETTNLTNVSVSGCNDICLLQQALSAKNADICLNISNVTTRQDCYVLLSNTSVSVCLRLDNSAEEEKCVTNHAKLGSNLSVCSLISDPGASRCMAAVNPCYAVSGSARLLCLALQNNSYSICGKDTECLLNYSQATKSTAPCEQLSLVSEQYACYAVAGNKDKCANLGLQSQKDLCYEIFAIRTNDSILCSAITPDSQYMYECLSSFAVSLKTLNICDTTCNDSTCIKFNNRWKCYENYSLGTGDISGCAAIDPLATSSKFTCYYDYAKYYGNPSVCDQFADPSQINSCYVGAIYNNTRLNYVYCAGMSLEQWRNNCYTSAARNANDSSICDYITTANERNSCIANVP